MRLGTACLLVVVAASAAGCVEEVDPSLRAEREPVPQAEVTPAPAVEVMASVRDCAVQLAIARVPAGTVALQVRNDGGTPQELVLRGGQEEWSSGSIPAGETAQWSVALAAGTYTLGCPPGTAATASDATLTVD